MTREFAQALLTKLPSFDLSWPDEIKSKWFAAFDQMITSGDPPILPDPSASSAEQSGDKKVPGKGHRTSGPWRLDEELDVCAEGGELIASAFPMVADCEAREANARLIAAAPDLLEACKHMLDFCPAGLMRDLQAAIAKAEGVHPANEKASKEAKQKG